MRKSFKKGIAFALAAVTLGSTVLTGCGQKSKGGETEFTWLLDQGVDSKFYTEYEENPAVQYWLSNEWGENKTKLSVDFQVPTIGSEADNMNTLLATGEYPDVMGMNFSSANAEQLYDEGIALDLTEYVDKYMPNYKAWIEENGIENEVTNEIDGERKYLMLYVVADGPEDPWGGLYYRRDWIVKYGKNPTTGAAFTGGYDAENVWSDDVVFPSGEADPVTITDWEWMLDIFSKALTAEGITDGYALSIPYSGYYGSGDMRSSFGGGAIGYYINEAGECVQGATEEGTRAYIECMANWYKNGWIDPAFEERASDMFFMVNTPATYTGKVGSWYGLSNQLGKGLDSGEEYTKGICVYGASQPINDKYGDAKIQNIEPNMFYQSELVSTGVVITNKAEDKDLSVLLSAIDYLYSTEGGLLRSYGFSDKQQAELKNEFYSEYGLDEGCYTEETDEDGNLYYKINPDKDNNADGLSVAVNCVRLPGLTINENLDQGRNETIQHGMDQNSKYGNTAAIKSTYINKLTADQSAEISPININILTYLSQAVPDFITGRKDITNDSDWKAYCDEINAYGPEIYCGYINEIINE